MLVFRGVYFSAIDFSVGLPGLPEHSTTGVCHTMVFGGLFFFGSGDLLGTRIFFVDFFTVNYHRIHHQQGPPFGRIFLVHFFQASKSCKSKWMKKVFFWEILNFGKDGGLGKWCKWADFFLLPLGKGT